MLRLCFGKQGLFKWQTVLLAAVLVSGCHRPYRFLPDDTYKLPRRVAGTADAQVAAMVRSFNRGKIVNVISIGSDYLISVPAAALFPENSPRLLWQSYPQLNQIARFLKQFRKVAVTVTIYSGQYMSKQREHALTLARARAVGNYLWSQGIDSRLIFTQGTGSDKPVTTFRGRGDHTPGSRMEITFRDAVG